MKLFILIIGFLLGTCIGSFMSVAIPRLKNGEKGIIRGRSKCPHCQKNLKASDLIPLLSFTLLRGRCRFCQKKISAFYPIIELITGLIFVFIIRKFAPLQFTQDSVIPWVTTLLYFIYSSILIFTFFYDLKYMEISDHILLPGIILALTATILKTTPNIIDALIGAAIPLFFFGLQIFISKGAWMGGGDLRIGAFIGLILGWKLVMVALILSYILGAFLSMGLILGKRATLKTAIPFAPLLVTGTFLTIFFGENFLQWYLQRLFL